MDIQEIIDEKKLLEKDIFEIVNKFELWSSCMVEDISIKRKRIETNVGSRNALDKITVRVILPEL